MKEAAIVLGREKVREAKIEIAAEIAGMSQRTIQLWIDNGTLSAIRIGNNYKVSRDSFASTWWAQMCELRYALRIYANQREPSSRRFA